MLIMTNENRPEAPTTRHRALLMGLLASVTLLSAYSQALPQNPPTDEKKQSDETIVLSPFVLEESNKGYYATNTMSGTRMNTSLEDLGASISVVTKQQMEDFALLDVNDIFLYEANTEGIGNFTDFTVDRNGNVIDNAQGNPNSANRIRGIAAANLAFGNFETSGRVPVDPINIQAVEISRGPNANIFGLGRASGTVNMVPSRADVRRSTNQLSLRVDDLGGNRVALDINRPFVKGQLGFRLGLVRQEDHFHRKPSVSRTKRINPMITWQPSRTTTLRVSMEDYENFSRRPNYMTPRDTIGYWIANGKPSWDPYTWTAKLGGKTYAVVPYNSNTTTENTALPPGIESGGSGLYARPSLFVDNANVRYWTVNRQSGVNTSGMPTPDSATGNIRFMESSNDLLKSRPALFPASLGLTDQSIYDWESINLVATNFSEDKVRTYRVELDQQIFRTALHSMHFNGGWFREDANKYSRNFLGQEAALLLYVDVNERYLDGSPNPYFGRPYLGASEPSTYRTPLLRDTYRAQLAYDLNLTTKSGWMKHLGRHTVLGYGEYKSALAATLRYRDAILSNHAWIPAGSARANSVTAARGYYRYYVGDANGHNVDYSTPHIYNLWGKYDLNWYNNGAWVKETAEIGEAAYLATPAPNKNIIKTKGMLTQHHFLDGRIVGTLGTREDRSYNKANDASGVPLLADGIQYDTTDMWKFQSRTWLERVGKTKNYGLVAKPLPWLNLHYNRSDSFLPSTPAQSLLLETLPDPSGEGKDYGFSINLFNQKLILRFNTYKNSQINTRAGDSGIIATRAGRLDFTVFGNDGFSIERNLRNSWTSGLTEDQIRQELFRITKVTPEYYDGLRTYPIAETSDIVSRGKEIEINYNPDRYWRSRVTIGQQRTFDANLSPNIQKFLDWRMPVWESIIDPLTGTKWMDTRYGSAGTPRNFLINSVLAPYKLARANEGKAKSQIREWRANFITNYSLAGITDNRWLKAVNLGGAVRWEDKASIGYYWKESDQNEFDPERRIWDKSRAYFDFTVSYTQRILKNSVTARYQLNVRNAFENGRLQSVAALPDGAPYAFRIIDPRQIILSATFDF